MPVTAQSLALQAELDAQVQKITDAQTRSLVAAWVVAWAEVAADLQDTLVELLTGSTRVARSTMLRSVQLRRTLATIDTKLEGLAEFTNVTITRDLPDVVRTASRAQADIIGAQLPDTAEFHDLMAARWTPAENRALEAIVQRTTGQIESATDRLPEKASQALRRELIRGVTVGSNPRETARRMVARAEGEFNGGLTRAMNLSRTETLDAHRDAARAGRGHHADVLTGWVWLCHLSPRTCPSCLVRHGTLHPVEEPGPEDHPQGRCTAVPKTKTWRELGIDLDEPADDFPDARTWFDALTPAEQAAIMGPTRLQLLRAGDIAWDDLATLRRNPDWRPSWQVTPVRTLTQRSRARAAS
jgi:hypothetical protein